VQFSAKSKMVPMEYWLS